MKFFADTAIIEDIEELAGYGVLDGVTTNPSLIAKSGRNFLDVVAAICGAVNGPVSAEVASCDYVGMAAEAEKLARIAENVVIKLPMTWPGLKLCRELSVRNIKTNVTLCFSANQALLAAKAGATYVSPFIGRLDDINIDGGALIREIRCIYDNFSFATEVLAASVRTVNHVKEAALAGADVATAPPDVIRKLIDHVLTDKGLQQFDADWRNSGQTIL